MRLLVIAKVCCSRQIMGVDRRLSVLLLEVLAVMVVVLMQVQVQVQVQR